MRCEQSVRFVELEALGALSDIDTVRLREHLATCSACRAVREQTQALRRSLASGCADGCANEERVDAIVAMMGTVAQERGARHGTVRIWAVAASLAVCAGALAFVVSDRLAGRHGGALSVSWKVDGVRVGALAPAFVPVVHGSQTYVLRATPRGDMVAALETRSGAERWVASVASRGHVAVDESGVYCVSVEPGNGGAVVAMSPEDGSVTWEYAPSNAAGNSAGLATAGGRVLWSHGRTLSALDARSGAVAWRHDCGSSGAVSRPLAILDRALVVCDGRVECLDIRDGSPVWTSLLDSTPSFLALPQLGMGDNRLYVAHRGSDLEGRVSCIDAATGQRVWSRHGVDAVHMTVCGSSLYVRGQSIEALDASTGRTLWQVAARGCSPLFCAQGFVVYADAARASAFSVLDGATGALVSTVDLPNACAGMVAAGEFGLVPANDGVMRAVPIGRVLSANGGIRL